jgi:epsilon-lactone hydrolase
LPPNTICNGFREPMTADKLIVQVRRLVEELIGGPDTPFLERRAQSAAFAQAFVLPDGVRIEPDNLDGIAVEWLIPDGAADAPILFHLHGGGYVLGNPAASRPFTTAFALKSGARVVSIDYRLAPEHPFPAAVEDSVKAYSTLLAGGMPAEKIAVGGESAGGGLAIAVLLAARAQRLAMPACAFAISPWVDMSCSASTFDSLANRDPMLTRRSLKDMADAYLAGASEKNPLASPLFGDLQGLPPLLIHAGSDEVLLDDARGLHERATEAGVASRLAVWEDMIHVWHMFHPMLPEGDGAIDEIVAFVKSHWR